MLAPARARRRCCAARLRRRLRARPRSRTRRSCSGSRSASPSLCLAAALIVVGASSWSSTEELEEELPAAEHPGEQEAIAQLVERERQPPHAPAAARSSARRRRRRARPGARSRRRPRSGPLSTSSASTRTPWRRGRRLVDENGRPLPRRRHRAATTSTPRSPRAPTRSSSARRSSSSGSPPGAAAPAAAARAATTPSGIVAYSKICTHAGCAISLYRAPLFQPDEPRPALVCPCHYSTFDPGDRRHGHLRARPAASCRCCRSTIDRAGYLRAAGNFDGPVGPSWWGVADCGSRARDPPRRPLRSTSAPAPRRSCARRCATSSPTTGRSCSARSRSTASSSSSRPGSTCALLRRLAPRRSSTTARTRRSTGSTMTRGLPRRCVDLSLDASRPAC